MGQINNKSTHNHKSNANFHRNIVDILTNNLSKEDCKLQLAYQFTRIIREFTGDQIILSVKQCIWPESVKATKTSITTSTRRVRMLDRMVFYGKEYKYTHEDMYNAFYCVCPHIEKIIRINKGQTWESNEDWYIYDVFARLVLLCIPDKSIQFLKAEWELLFADIVRIYPEEEATKIQNFCEFLNMQLKRMRFEFSNGNVGMWITRCIEHFCDIGLSESQNITEEDVIQTINTANFIMYYSLIHPKLWFHDPYTLVASAVNSAITFLGKGSWGNWYKVECRTAVRKGVMLDSQQISLLNAGTLVHVVEKFGRRVQVDQPHRGFCSLHDGAGLDILRPLDNDDLLTILTKRTHEGLQSPFRDMTRWIFTDRTSTYVHLKSKFQSEDFGNVSSLRFFEGQLLFDSADPEADE